MKVLVTPEDISKGLKLFCDACPVARAMSRASGRKTEVGFLSWWYASNDQEMFDLPREVVGWILAFDKGEKVKPMEFST